MTCLASLYGFFVPYRRKAACADFFAYMRGAWLRKEFKQMGEEVYFYRPGLLKGMEYISIGDNTGFEKDLYLTAWDTFETNEGKQTFTPAIEIGNGCHIGVCNHITAIDRIVMGNGCLTGKWVTITDNAHGDFCMEALSLPPAERPLCSKGPVVIGDNVWMGDKVTILPGVTIGNGAVIAANAVVTRDVPAYSLAAGVPARIIKQIQENEK